MGRPPCTPRGARARAAPPQGRSLRGRPGARLRSLPAARGRGSRGSGLRGGRGAAGPRGRHAAPAASRTLLRGWQFPFRGFVVLAQSPQRLRPPRPGRTCPSPAQPLARGQAEAGGAVAEPRALRALLRLPRPPVAQPPGGEGPLSQPRVLPVERKASVLGGGRSLQRRGRPLAPEDFPVQRQRHTRDVEPTQEEGVSSQLE